MCTPELPLRYKITLKFLKLYIIRMELHYIEYSRINMLRTHVP